AYPPVYVPPPPGYAIATGFATGLAFGAGIAVANSLWGGVNWNTHDVNINVNRYNNINVNNRLNVNSSTTNWNRNTNVNRNINNANLNRDVNNNLGGARHDAYRGRDDAARTDAQRTLQNRTGQNLSGNASDRVRSIHQGGTANGNLQSNSQQKVVVEQSTIQIVPANPQVVYVPTYNPTVVYGAWPYPAYPPVYVPPPPGYAIASGLAAGLAFGAGVAVANSLWGGFNWNSHDVNINVNRYNNINVNNRINSNTSTANWNRNTNVNRTNANLNAQRDAYRGRDTSRAQAQQTLQNRTGQNLGGTANQRVQGIHQGGTNAGDVRNSAQNMNRDNALRGSGDGKAARQDVQRGQTSRQSLANNTGSGKVGAGGAGQQAGGGNRLGANGGGQQRSGMQGGGGGAGAGQRSGGFGGGGGGGGGGGHHLGRGR
ncbi:MAG TPA: DUF3300 domain-containing protein, partial [Paraburkholderia sp.]